MSSHNGLSTDFNIMDFLLDNQTKQYLKKISSQVTSLLYNEFYVYIWFICIYNIFVLALIITNLALLIQLYSFMKENSKLLYKISEKNNHSSNMHISQPSFYHYKND